MVRQGEVRQPKTEERPIMSRKPWLSAYGDTYFKARLRALVRDNFICQFAHLQEHQPDPALYDPDLWAKVITAWHGLDLAPLPNVCTAEAPLDHLPKLQVHHIIERTYFRPEQMEGHDLSNLITLCEYHHARIHPHLAKVREAPTLPGFTRELGQRDQRPPKGVIR